MQGGRYETKKDGKGGGEGRRRGEVQEEGTELQLLEPPTTTESLLRVPTAVPTSRECKKIDDDCPVYSKRHAQIA